MRLRIHWSVVALLSLAIALACTQEREPARSSANVERSTPNASASPSPSADAATTAELPEAGPPPADGAQGEQPFVLKGARRCTSEELDSEFCAEGSRPGACLEEHCVTEANCPRYCEAKADHDSADCRMDASGCEGVAECISAAEQTNRDCAALRSELLDSCLRVQCPLIRTLPPP